MIEQIAWVADKNTILVFIWGGVNIFDKKVTHPNELFKASFEEYNLLKKHQFRDFQRILETFRDFQRVSEIFGNVYWFAEIFRDYQKC